MRTAVFISWLTISFIASEAHGQAKSHLSPEELAIELTEWMTPNLQLTNAQVPQVQTINLKYAHKLQELQYGTDTKQQKQRAFRADGDAKDQELKRVLTSEQFQTWLSKKDDLYQMMKEKMKKKKG
jgi:hypothetical protein